MSSKRIPREKVIRSTIFGVTFDNRDGSSRKDIIQTYCDAGMELEVRPEPDNPIEKDALGLWVQTRGVLGTRNFQVGYVQSELADKLLE